MIAKLNSEDQKLNI